MEREKIFSTQFFGEVLSRFTYFTSRVLNLSKLYLDLSHSLLRLLLGVTQSEKQVPCLYPGGENCRSLLSENFQMSNEAKSCGEFATTQNVVMSALHHNLYVTLLGNTAGERRGLNQSGTSTTMQDQC